MPIAASFTAYSGTGGNPVKLEASRQVATIKDGEPARQHMAAAARVPFARGQRAWLLVLPCILLSLDLSLALVPAGPRTVLTLLFVIATWMITLRLSARCLLASAAGARTLAERQAQDIPPGLVGRLVVLWLLAMVPASAVLTGASVGWLAALLAVLVLAALVPATLMLARSPSLLDALDPLYWRDLVVEVGWRPGLDLVGTLFVLAGGYLLLSIPALPPFLQSIQKAAVLFYWIWATIAWFDLAGRVVHGPASADDTAPAGPEGIDSLFERLVRSGGTPQQHRRLADALTMSGERSRRLAHGRIHVNALLAGFDRPKAAVEEAARLLDQDPTFCLDDTESMYALVRASRVHGYPALTIRLCGNYLDGFPRSFKRDELRLIACEAAAAGGRDERRMTADWLEALIAAKLADDQRARLKRIVPAFLAEGLIRRRRTGEN